MGNSCSHKFSVVKDIRDVSANNWFYTEQMGRANCTECPKKDIVVFRTISKITKRESEWKFFDPRDCTHPTWDIQTDACRIGKEQTITGSFIRLFTGPALDGIQYHSYLIAEAKCKRCGYKWEMISDYKEEWASQELKKIPIGKWRDAKENVHISANQK